MVKFPFKIRLTPTELVNRTPMKVLLNSNLIETPLPFETSNRAFQYGDGIFETIWVRDGRAPLLEYHKRRIMSGAELLGLTIHPSRLQFLDANIETLRQFNCPNNEECVAKFMVWRHASDTYGYAPEKSDAETLLTIRPKAPSEPREIHLGISEKSVVHPSLWSSAKTLNSLPYVMAARECEDTSFDDLILTNPSHELAEATSANLWVLRNGEWQTPRLESGCVAGVMRAFMLHENWREPTTEATLLREDLVGADGIILSYATGITVVDKFDENIIPTSASHSFRQEVLKSVLSA